jgi:hypothetical protein
MAEATIEIEDTTDEILEKISALSKGFLLIRGESMEKACSFCRGLLILMNQYQDKFSENT